MFSDDTKLQKLYNRALEAAAKELNLDINESFRVITSKDELAEFENIGHFLNIMGK